MAAKESKNLGITKSCPECKKTIFRGLKFVGDSSEQTIKCPHCQTPLFIVVTKKTVVIISKAVLIIFLIIGTMYKVQAQKINCGAFLNRDEAQKAYNENPIKYARLDGNDKDNKVCEDYIYK